jgi:basic amino acid/polyamine antiporter, APA family
MAEECKDTVRIFPKIILIGLVITGRSTSWSRSRRSHWCRWSRLLYGMSRERVLPEQLGKVHPVRRTPYVAILFTTALAFGLIAFVGKVPALGGTTALLLLEVFTVVNIAVLVLCRSPVDHEHFVAPTMFPVMGAFSCAYLASPLTDRDPSSSRSPATSS